MKKIIVIALALVTLQVSAQERKEKRDSRPEFTAEEIAQLQTKKMTLDLDLTEAQQHKVSVINLENAKARKLKMEGLKSRKEKAEKPSKEELLKMKNERLDAQIATKKKMKAILSAEQYEKFEKIQGRKHKMRGQKKMKRRDSQHRERKQKREYKD